MRFRKALNRDSQEMGTTCALREMQIEHLVSLGKRKPCGFDDPAHLDHVKHRLVSEEISSQLI